MGEITAQTRYETAAILLTTKLLLEELQRRLPFGVCRPQLGNIGRLSL